MADSKRTNSVRFSLILDSLLKILPHLTREFLDQVPPVYEMSPSDILSLEDFQLLLDVRSRVNQNVGPHQSAVKRRNEISKSQGKGDNIALLKYLGEVMDGQGISASRLFKMADKD